MKTMACNQHGPTPRLRTRSKAFRSQNAGKDRIINGLTDLRQQRSLPNQNTNPEPTYSSILWSGILSLSLSLNLNTYIYIYMYVYIYIYICMYIYTYVCIYIYILDTSDSLSDIFYHLHHIFIISSSCLYLLKWSCLGGTVPRSEGLIHPASCWLMIHSLGENS